MRAQILAGLLLWTLPAFAGDNCTKKEEQAVCEDAAVQERVDWACKLLESKGRDSIPLIQMMRYECCGEPDYVWLNDMTPKMIMHPIKATMRDKDLSQSKDSNGKKLFVEFVEAVKQNPTGAWVDYTWPKFGETESTPKKSWVKRCKVGSSQEYWVVGSGTWK